MSQDIDINRIQYVAIVGSVLFVVFIVELIRKKKLKESFSLLWLSISIIFLIFSIWREGLAVVARYLGIHYPPSALFLFLLIGIIFILIQFSILISTLSEQNKVLAQELGLLKMEIKELKKKTNENKRIG
jgi:hypothetical protein